MYFPIQRLASIPHPPQLRRNGFAVATVLALLLSPAPAGASTPPSTGGVGASGIEGLDRPPVAFVENRGQWGTDARFISRSGATLVRVEPASLVLQLEEESHDGGRSGAMVRFTFDGGSREARIEGEGEQRGNQSFFYGSDPAGWRSGVRVFDRVVWRELYAGIDVVLRDEDCQLEYDLVLAPCADLSQVVVRCQGIAGMALDEDGSLVLESALGALVQTPPRTWCVLDSGDRVPVTCRVRLIDAERFGFEAAERDPDLPLVVDPGLEWSTYLGGSNTDRVDGIAVGPDGLVTICGRTRSVDFPATAGAYEVASQGGEDAFVCRVDPTATGTNQVVWATFLGGAGDDLGAAVALSPSGAVTVAGETRSADFPTTPGAFDISLAGIGDGFVARFSSDGSSLFYSTYLGGALGGAGIDHLYDLALDGVGAAVVTGYTFSSDFPTTPGAFDTTFDGPSDVFLTRLLLAGSGPGDLLYSTLLGGDYGESGNAVVLDATGAAVVVGHTSSLVTSDPFPTTPNAYATYPSGGATDAFVSRIAMNGNGAADLLYSTFLGAWGSGDIQFDEASAVAVDSSDRIYVAGHTEWNYTSFPTTPGAFETDCFHGGFFSLIDPGGNGSADLLYSTCLGGAYYPGIVDVALHPSGDVCLAGSTAYSSFPTTAGAYDATINGGSDTFVARLRPAGNGVNDLVYSSFVGGASDDSPGSNGLALDGAGRAVVGGSTSSSSFPSTAGAFQNALRGPEDGFVLRLDVTSAPAGVPFCFGDGTGASCPCGNSGSTGHGCANSNPSSAGALLGASGATSPDSVVLSASQMRPTALCIFFQGNVSIAPTVYGDGLRCIGGGFKRLASKNAVDGFASYPRFDEVSITARSAQLGDPIPSGGIRHYQTYYRDANPAFCPSPPGNTWNIANGVTITW